MIFLDANIFLRYLAPPLTPADHRWQNISHALFLSVETGEVTATTSEVVLHEVCYVLGASRHYGYPASEIVPAIRRILDLAGMKLPGGERTVYLRALDLWEQHPVLQFSDAVIAARCERGGHELATFDGHFDRVASVRKWMPETCPDGASAPEPDGGT